MALPDCELNQGIMYSLKFQTKDSGDTLAADWDSQANSWILSSKEYAGRSWYFLGKLGQSRLGCMAYTHLLSSFGLDPKEFPLQDIERMSPHVLAKVGTKDPISNTQGDNRRASEVRPLLAAVSMAAA